MDKFIVLGLNLLFLGGIPLALSLFGVADFYHALTIMLLLEAAVPTAQPMIVVVKKSNEEEGVSKYGPTTH